MFSDTLPGKRRQWPVRAGSGENSPCPFFVLGHPRSGTTLLRALLSRHPDVFIPPENGALWRMIRVFGDTRSGDWEGVVDSVLGEFEKGYEYHAWGLDSRELRDQALAIPRQERSLEVLIATVYRRYGERFAPGKTLWGDKTTPGSFSHLYKLPLVFPRSSYLHIIRDGRDCVASAMQAGFYDRDIGLAARAWRDNVRQCRRFGNGARGSRGYLEIHYESLVDDPASCLPGICKLLGIEPAAAMLSYDGDVADQLPDVQSLQHHANVTRPIFRNSVGKWRQQLSAQQCREVEQITGAELLRSGYQLQSG